MTNEERITNFAKENNDYITRKNVDNLKIHHYYLTNLVKKGTLIKISKGVYMLNNAIKDDYYIISQGSKHAVFSHATALYLHELSDRIPLNYDVTVNYKYSGNLAKNNNITLRYVDAKIFKLGTTEIDTINGLTIRVYDIERTICDIVRDKKNMDREIFKKALKAYAKLPNKNILKLMKYAKILKIEEEVIKYMEVLL